MSVSEYLKPLPEPSIDSQPFWDGLKERKILLQTCTDCGTKRHYPRPMCSECHSMDAHWTETTGFGAIYSWTESHHPFHFGLKAETPYILVTVTLDEGVRIQTKLLDAKVEDLKLDQKVKVVFAQETDDLVLPYFRLV
jgi:uncharacterized OB-fold protein